MKTKAILFLGGYGGTGQVVSRLLLKETDVDIIVAGRSIIKAEELTPQLIKEFTSKRVLARYADASNYESLVAAFKDVSMVIVASTATQYVKHVAQAAIDAEIDYHDYHYQHFGPPFGVRSGYPLHTDGGHRRKSQHKRR